MPGLSTSRRGFLMSMAAVAGSRGLPLVSAASDSDGVKLGVASYSLRKLNRQDAISAIKELGARWVNIKSFHLPYENSPAELKQGRREIENAGLAIVGRGTITLRKDDDSDIGQYFEYAKQCGMPLMVIAPTAKTMPRIERFVKQYDIKVAVHNHGPEDPHFPAPQDVLRVVKNMDPRVGLCIDVGHTARTGVDVAKSIAEAGDRLLDMHIKDLRSFTDKASQCAVGEGLMPVAKIFGLLKKMNYQGYVNLEYEIFPDHPLPGMKQSFAYMRGVLAGLA